MTAALTFDVAPGEPADDAPIPVDLTAEPSGIDRLKAKMAAARAEAAAKLSFRLPVPRMPDLVVEFKPVDQRIWNGLLEAASKQKGVTTLQINARMLAAFATGIYLDDDGTLVSADLDDQGKPAPKFERRLAEALGLPWSGDQADLVREIYMADGDVISTAAAVLDLSGFGRQSEIEASVRTF